MIMSACGAVISANAQSENDIYVTGSASLKAAKKPKVTKKQRLGYYKNAAFIGSSIGLGQRTYFKGGGKKYVGSPVMLVRGCYSFYNDKHKRKDWMVTLDGTPMQARFAVKAAKVKRVFIAMGTNDFHGSAESVYKDYVEYVKGIRKTNPKVEIFIESTTSVAAARQGKYLNSKNVAALNEMMAEYCKKCRDMYFIDVSSKMNDKKGNLMRKYTSDNYVHLTNDAYELWTKEMVKFTNKLILKQRAAKKAVKKAEKSRRKDDVKAAKAKIKKLEKSTLKKSLLGRVKKIKVKEEATTVAEEPTGDTTPEE